MFTALSDSSGNPVEYYDYGSYGTPFVYDASGNQLLTGSFYGNPYMFTGRRFDLESRFYYYRTRYMEPTMGRFTTTDVIGVWGDALNVGNAPNVVASNPWSWLDPLGLSTDCSKEEAEAAHWERQFKELVKAIESNGCDGPEAPLPPGEAGRRAKAEAEATKDGTLKIFQAEAMQTAEELAEAVGRKARLAAANDGLVLSGGGPSGRSAVKAVGNTAGKLAKGPIVVVGAALTVRDVRRELRNGDINGALFETNAAIITAGSAYIGAAALTGAQGGALLGPVGAIAGSGLAVAGSVVIKKAGTGIGNFKEDNAARQRHQDMCDGLLGLVVPFRNNAAKYADMRDDCLKKQACE